MALRAPAAKEWATTNNIEVFQPTNYKDGVAREKLTSQEWDLFIVVAYNFILPQWLLDIPKKGAINVHPSLLPKLRGPSPIRSAILQDEPESVGVTIMLLDEKMDHGPIVAQAGIDIDEDWPLDGVALDETLANSGAYLLAQTVPNWLAGNITPTEQDHDEATYTKLFKKGDNELHIDVKDLPSGDAATTALAKIRAWSGIGDTFFMHDGQRVKVKTASLATNGSLVIESVVPAGKREMSFESYLQSLRSE
jgi:methionyl-tRNA formyltransferase